MKQMVVNMQVSDDLNLHLNIEKKYFLTAVHMVRSNLESETSAYGKKANMWQMGSLIYL